MPKRVQLRGANTAAHAVFTGAQREVTVDTDKKVLVVHDGATAGGFPAARADLSAQNSNNLSDLGNAATARTNLSVLSKIEAHAMANVRRLAGGVSFNGVSSQRAYSSLSGYSIGTNHFSVRAIIRVPTSTTAIRGLFLIGSSSSAAAANSFLGVITTSGALQVRLYGASTSDYTYAEVANFLTNYGGKAVEILVVRSWSGLAVYLNGVAATVGATLAFGTGPGWTGSITSTFLSFGSAGSSPFYGDLYALSLFNYPLSASQALKLAQEGLAPQDLWASDAELILAANDRTFAGANNWVNTSMTTFDSAGDLSVTANAANLIAYLDSVDLDQPLSGHRYQIVADVANLFGSFHFRGSDALVNVGNLVSGKYVAVFDLESALFTDLQLVSGEAASAVDIDNISVKAAGAVLDLDFSEATKWFAPDRSTNKFHAVLAASIGSEVTLLSPARRGFLRGRTNTNGNQQFLGHKCLPANARISQIIINSDNSGTPVTAVDIGTASGGAQIASAVPIVSGRQDVGTFASRYGSAGEEIWINSDGTSNLDITILFDLVD